MALSKLGVSGLNIDELKSYLSRMSPQQRQQVAAQYKNSPYASIVIPLAMGITQEEQRMSQGLQAQQQAGQQEQPKVVDEVLAQMAPQDQGIAQLPAQNIAQMADGGIAGYDDTEPVERYQSKGLVQPNLFDDAFNFVLGVEGEQYVPDDAGKGPTKFGINASANPDVDVKSLTKDKAKSLYKQRYWDAINGDALAQKDPALAKAAFDTAVNMGVGTAKQLVSASGGDVNKLLDMRRNRYAELVQNNPQRFAPFASGWENRLTKLAAALPISSAQAARPDLVSQIPGQTAAGRTTKPESTDRTMLDRIFGAGEAATSMATGLAAIPLGAGRKLLQEAAYGRSDPMADQMARYTFAPRGEAGKEYVEGMAQLAQDLKIPGYLPAATPIGPGLRAATQMGRAGAQADEAAAAAAQAAAPRIPGQLVSDTRVPGEVAVPSTAVPGKPAITNIPTSGEAARQAAALAAQREAAAAAAQRSGAAQQGAAAAQVAGERMGAEGAYTGAAGARANLAGAAGTAAQAAPGAEVPPETPFIPAPGDDSYDRKEKNLFIRQAMERLGTDVSRKDLAETAKKVAPEAGGKGWKGEDWLLLGLGLMASKNPRFLGALGEAGLGVVKERREQAKEEATEAYRRALTREAEAKAKVYESGTGDAAKATKYANEQFDNWLNGVKANPMLQMNITPEQIEAKRREYLREAYAMFKIDMPAGVGTGATQGWTVTQRPS